MQGRSVLVQLLRSSTDPILVCGSVQLTVPTGSLFSFQNFAMGDHAQINGSFYATWMFQWAFAATAGTIVSVRRRRFLFLFRSHQNLRGVGGRGAFFSWLKQCVLTTAGIGARLESTHVECVQREQGKFSPSSLSSQPSTALASAWALHNPEPLLDRMHCCVSNTTPDFAELVRASLASCSGVLFMLRLHADV